MLVFLAVSVNGWLLSLVLKVTRVIKVMMPSLISSHKLIMMHWLTSPASTLLRGERMTTINGRACVANGTPVDKVFSNGRQIYGRNLIINSNFSAGLDHWIVNRGTNADCEAVVTTDSDGDACIHITGTGALCGLWARPVSFNQNQVTTGSVLAKGIGELNRVGLEGRPLSNFGTISTESYSKVGSTSQASSNTNNFVVYFNRVDGEVDVYIKFVKLELGSQATPWTPAPEDVM